MRAHAFALIIGAISLALLIQAFALLDKDTRDVLLQVPTAECVTHGFTRADTIGGEWYCVVDRRDGQVKVALARLEERHE